VKYLIDTNILIYLCNSKSEVLEQKFKRHQPEVFAVSSITVGELIYGVNKSKNKEKNLHAILKILSPFQIIDFTSSDGWEYGLIRAELEAKGTLIGGNDIMIAAQARRRKLIVITNNIREYQRVSDLPIEDWSKG
jgi:tRNA(fMet)-specific endonuclease VapC